MRGESESKEAIAERLRVARDQAGLTQAQASKKMNMHRPTVSEIEAGRRRVTADEVAAFARLYGVSVNWLVAGAAQGPAVDPRVDLAARELARLKPDDLNRLLDLLASLRRGDGEKR